LFHYVLPTEANDFESLEEVGFFFPAIISILHLLQICLFVAIRFIVLQFRHNFSSNIFIIWGYPRFQSWEDVIINTCCFLPMQYRASPTELACTMP
jgi:hypothetical protein